MQDQDAALALYEALTEDRMFPESLAQKFTLEQSYDVQFALLNHRVAAGEHHSGWKVGLTSRAMQEQQGVHEPCLGHLVREGHRTSPCRLAFDDLMAPGFENELCLRIGRPLRGEVSFDEARAAIEAVAPAIEVIEKRGVFANDLPLAFAGNAQQRAWVTGDFVDLEPDVDLAEIEVSVTLNGALQETAKGAEVLGSPVHSVVFLTRKLAEFGHGLNPGDHIMSGSFTRQYSLAKGDRVQLGFTRFGSVDLEVV